MSSCRSQTPAPASTPPSSTVSSSPSSPPRASARAPASACPPCTPSRPATAVPFKSRAQPGVGSTFKVFLPAEVNASAPTPADPAAVPRGQGELILVIDDETIIRSVTRQTLETHGYRVLTAADGAEGIALFAQQPAQIAAVITDMMMPVMDGPATIHAMLHLKPRARIIAASGLNSQTHVAKATRPASPISSPSPTLPRPCSLSCAPRSTAPTSPDVWRPAALLPHCTAHSVSRPTMAARGACALSVKQIRPDWFWSATILPTINQSVFPPAPPPPGAGCTPPPPQTASP